MTLPERTNRSLRLVYAGLPTPRSTVLLDILRSHGHEVREVLEKEEALASAEPDVWVIENALEDCSGLHLLEELRGRGHTTPVVMLDERPSFDQLRRALELEVSDFVLRPFEPGALLRSVARAHDTRPRFPGEEHTSYRRRYAAGGDTVGHAARELSAFLTKHGVSMAQRVRIASALAELVDNACRHAYPAGNGDVTVEVHFDRARVGIRVEDQGRGFDARNGAVERVKGVLPAGKKPVQRATPGTPSKGLARVATLCERHEIRSSPRGTEIELTCELTHTRFPDEPEDFSETDFLDPARARALLAALRDGASSLANVAPSLALTIGRLLGGSSDGRPASRR